MMMIIIIIIILVFFCTPTKHTKINGLMLTANCIPGTKSAFTCNLSFDAQYKFVVSDLWTVQTDKIINTDNFQTQLGFHIMPFLALP